MLFSVVIPVYNVENFLDDCVLSFIHQKDILMEDMEIILVDDGSTDSSPEKCDYWKTKYPDVIKVIHKKNQGLLLARRTGYAEAIGDYIVNCDSDDFAEDRMLCSLKRTILKNAPDVILFNIFVLENESKTPMFKNIFTNEAECGVKKEDILIDYLSSYHIVSMCAKSFKRSLLDGNINYEKFKKLGFGEDALQSLEVFDSANSFWYINSEYYNYRQGYGMTDSFNENYFDTFMIVFEEIEKHAKNWNLENKDELLAMKFFSIVGRSITQGKDTKFSYEKRRKYCEHIRANKFFNKYCYEYKKIKKRLQKSHKFLISLLQNKMFFLLHVSLNMRKG